MKTNEMIEGVRKMRARACLIKRVLFFVGLVSVLSCCFLVASSYADFSIARVGNSIVVTSTGTSVFDDVHITFSDVGSTLDWQEDWMVPPDGFPLGNLNGSPGFAKDPGAQTVRYDFVSGQGVTNGSRSFEFVGDSGTYDVLVTVTRATEPKATTSWENQTFNVEPELPAGALAPVMGLIGVGAWMLRRRMIAKK